MWSISSCAKAAIVVFGDSLLGNQLDLKYIGLNPSGAMEVVPGILNVYEQALSDLPADLNSGQADRFTLATLIFSVVNPGSSQLAITAVNTLGDADGNVIVADTLPTAVTTVPVPSVAWLFGTALLGFLGSRGI